MQKQSHLQQNTTSLLEGQENLPPLPSETILDETPVPPSRSHNFAAQYFSTRDYKPLIFAQTGTASTAALTNQSVEPSGSAHSLAGTYFSTRSLRPFTFALAGKTSSPFSAPAGKETTTPIMTKMLSDREKCLLMWGV